MIMSDEKDNSKNKMVQDYIEQLRERTFDEGVIFVDYDTSKGKRGEKLDIENDQLIDRDDIGVIAACPRCHETEVTQDYYAPDDVWVWCCHVCGITLNRNDVIFSYE